MGYSPALHVIQFRYRSERVSKLELKHFVSAFLRFWKNPEWKLRDRRSLLVTLAFVHRRSRRKSRFLESRFRSADGELVRVLDELTSVPMKDAMSWLEEEEVASFLRNAELYGLVRAAIKGCY
ncbi:MAG: hypothetical protein AAF357_17395, partial [Verrucomicrobiota bacterium]